MTRAERKELKLKLEEDFRKKESFFEKECFDVSSPYFTKMLEILDSAKSRGLEKGFGFELHHKIPRSYFAKKKMKVIDEGNLYKLTYQEHFLVHFYAYKCATKLMKPSMTAALIQMKRVCCMNTNDVDVIKLAYIFDSIKVELYREKKKDSQNKYFQQNFKKVDEVYSGKFRLLRSTRINSKSNEHTEFDLECRECGRKFTVKSGNYFLKGKYTCECQFKGYQEDVDVLWFGIDYRYQKAVWMIRKISYTPSMERCGTLLKKGSAEVMHTQPIGPFEKLTCIDVKPAGYNWKLPENKKYDSKTTMSYILEDSLATVDSEANSPKAQKYRRLVREGKAIPIPTWQIHWLYTQYCKDPKSLDRIIAIIKTMYELNDGKDVKDFKL